MMMMTLSCHIDDKVMKMMVMSNVNEMMMMIIYSAVMVMMMK